MQAPGGRDEDPSGGFEFGGWSVPYADAAGDAEMEKQMGQPFDLLLGRKTYDIFAAYWPHHSDGTIGSGINEATKYVVTDQPIETNWEKTVPISGDIIAEIQKLKQQDGPMLQVHGSSVLIHQLLASDLVDELWLKTYPVILGKGKRLFDDGAKPAAFMLASSVVTPSGVFFASYKRAGDVQTGTFD
jgi:dihydrofolate reductase